MTKLRRWRTPILAVAIFVFAMWQFLPPIEHREFHRDEARWIHRTVYLQELANPFGDYWDEATWAESGTSLDERYRLRAQPPVGSYLMGIGFLLQGQPLPDIGYWNMDHDTQWNTSQGNMPTDAMLTAARRTTATLTALTAVAIYLIGAKITSNVGAVIGATYFAAHPLSRYLATFAGSDAALIFFIALSVLSAARLAEKPTWPRAMLLGIAIGLGGGVKLSPLGIVIALAALGILILFNPTTLSKQLGLMLLSTPVIAGVTFVASYPYFWRNPIGNSLDVLRYRTISFDLQSSLWSKVAIDTPNQAAERIWMRFSSADWSLIGRFTGRGLPLENVLAIVGTVILAVLVLRRGIASSTSLVAIAIGASTVVTILGMKVDWARYHFPILLAMAVCIGVVAGSVATWIHPRKSPT